MRFALLLLLASLFPFSKPASAAVVLSPGVNIFSVNVQGWCSNYFSCDGWEYERLFVPSGYGISLLHATVSAELQPNTFQEPRRGGGGRLILDREQSPRGTVFNVLMRNKQSGALFQAQRTQDLLSSPSYGLYLNANALVGYSNFISVKFNVLLQSLDDDQFQARQPLFAASVPLPAPALALLAALSGLWLVARLRP